MRRMLLSLLVLATAPDAAFTQLKAIAGDWELRTGEKALRVSYKTTAADSVLVETWTTASGATTMTVFHMDGPQLVATHYCAQGNQPRLRWNAKSNAFEFWDATNLPSAKASHLVKLELGLTTDGKLRRREVYAENGKEDASEVVFSRK